MAGTGIRGPVPKRTAQRRRVNKPEIPVETAPPNLAATPSPRGTWKVPLAAGEWHQVAKDWYQSLKKSGQSAWFQPSDWMEAYVAAEVLSRMLEADKLSAMLYASWAGHTSRLLVTEGDRRRVRIELERAQQKDPDKEAGVASMKAWRDKLAGGA
jgi:hypothetical protein